MCHSELSRLLFLNTFGSSFTKNNDKKKKKNNKTFFELALIISMTFIHYVLLARSLYHIFSSTFNNSSNISFFILAPLYLTFSKLFLYLLGDHMEGSEWIHSQRYELVHHPQYFY